MSTPIDPTGADLDANLRAANGRGRIAFDTPPVPAEVSTEEALSDSVPAPVELSDDELDALLRSDRTTRRETLADPEVRIRLAMRDPDFRAHIERLEERVKVAEEVAARRVADAAGPRPMPLPGGGAAPVPPAPPSAESILRSAVAAAKGEPIDHRMRPYVRPAHDVSVTGFTP